MKNKHKKLTTEKLPGNNEILIEINDLYDGWACTFNKETKEIKWRDAFFTNRLSQEWKQDFETRFKESNPELYEPSTPKNKE